MNYRKSATAKCRGALCDPAGKFANLHLRCELLLCDPAGAQTQNLQNRNLTLYSIELRGRCAKRINYLLLPIKTRM